jgi:hypothetical protein
MFMALISGTTGLVSFIGALAKAYDHARRPALILAARDRKEVFLTQK